ncbi:hypothetical protein BX600DRAFT_389320 [Xylariales sp. PMI_506]|nr:hypothetical protein BX600DRAFT_389320 [Xylariales sp. PMI_506]
MNTNNCPIAYKLRKHLADHVDVVLYEKSPELGGTWYENKYPGCACDVPSHVYQYIFAPNPEWSKFYASSQEIQGYLKRVAKYFDLERFIHFNIKVVSARWLEESSTWKIELEDGNVTECDVLINAGGILNNFKWPDIHGFDSFLGPKLHTAAWDSNVDLVDKRVAVIGAGASAIQLLPQIQPKARHVDIYIRSPSWITPPVASPSPEILNYSYNEEDQGKFRQETDMYLRTRKYMEDQLNGSFKAFRKGSAQQEDRRSRLAARMKSLISDESLQERLIPTFEVGCRRINPGEGYLLALQEWNVQPIFQPIEKVNQSGIVVDGLEHPVDVIVAATGFNTSFRPRFPIIGRNGVNLQDLWAEEPTSYFGTSVSGFPNYLIFLGPNTPISNGSLIGPLEATSDYFIRLLRKMFRQRAKSFEVREKAQHDFDKHTQKFMHNMVWTGSCRSWFKKGENGKVTALWPGSALHYMQILAEDRWEDYEWIHDGNMFEYWKSGLSWIEDPQGDPLGVSGREDLDSSTTIPRKGSDLSFYLSESEPLPMECVQHPDRESPLHNTTEAHVSSSRLGQVVASPIQITPETLHDVAVPV